ncbi:MAG TPA: hypothetical protein VEC35_01155 [Noviherbaspirillum sp.]|nr:hypothetical protein [Noviherbaspirillum sp.]
MTTNNIPGNTSLEEVLKSIEMDPKATDREKYMVQYFRSNGGNTGWYPVIRSHER